MNALLPFTNNFVVVNGDVCVAYIKKRISVLGALTIKTCR